MSNMPSNAERIEWWKKARFGLFIHWGLYAVPAGTWKGEQIPSIGEWIMRNAKIPIAEYEKLCPLFNPVEFDADAWVRLAKRAGMKYIVITSKHHDGFCMFRSPSNPFNIYDATPFKRDPMAELAEACREHGLKLCFYYSQAQDWHAPGGAGHWEEAPKGGGWHGYTRPPEDFQAYLDDVVKPNLKELLTNYGPIGLIWFDTPVAITREQSEDLRDYVHELQPECLVSGRVGHDVGDYGSMGDNQIPVGRVEGYWETPATLNDTWGYKSYDHNWKSLDTLLYLLVDLASKGVNYLLNVGPTAEGLIPEPSIKLLEGIGQWMDTNSEAIHGTDASPFPYEFGWGRMTQCDNKLYLLVTDWPGTSLKINGLRSSVHQADILGSSDAEVGVSELHDPDTDWHELELVLPTEAPDPCATVIRLTLGSSVDVDESPLQQADGSLSLPAHMAATAGNVSLSKNGITEGWKGPAISLSWVAKVRRPGTFRVEVLTAGNRHSGWKGGHTLKLSCGSSTAENVLTKDGDSNSPRAQYFPEVISVLGDVEIPEAGPIEICLEATALNPDVGPGVQLSEVRLIQMS